MQPRAGNPCTNTSAPRCNERLTGPSPPAPKRMPSQESLRDNRAKTTKPTWSTHRSLAKAGGVTHIPSRGARRKARTSPGHQWQRMHCGGRHEMRPCTMKHEQGAQRLHQRIADTMTESRAQIEVQAGAHLHNPPLTIALASSLTRGPTHWPGQRHPCARATIHANLMSR